MASLLSLPDDVLLLVVSLLDNCSHKKALWNVCLSAKRLYNVAYPLFERYYINGPDCHCRVCTPYFYETKHCEPLLSVAKSLIANPDLATTIQRTCLNTFQNECDQKDVRDLGLDSETIKVLSHAFRRLPSCDNAVLFMQAVEMWSNPYILLITSRTHDLEDLEFTLGVEGLDYLEPLFTTWPGCGFEQPYLNQLKSLTINDRCFSMSESMSTLHYVLLLPQLETFTISILDGDRVEFPNDAIEPRSLNFSSLSLLEACMDFQGLSMIVAGCKSLREFVYSGRNFDGNTLESSCQFNLSQLVSILSPQKDNLQVIRCTLDWEDITPAAIELYSRVDSLVPFRSLNYLELDQYSYSPGLGLPPSLEALFLSNVSFPFNDVLENLGERKVRNQPDSSCSLPHLSSVTMRLKDDIPNTMLGLPLQISHHDVYREPRVKQLFKAAFESLESYASHYSFTFYMDHPLYTQFNHGYLYC